MRLQKFGVIARENIVYGALLRTIHELMPYNYSLIEVKTDHGAFKIYTHFEGVQVIDEIFCLEEYRKAFEYSPCTVVDLGAHIGTFTLLATNIILNTHGDGLIVSVEPASINYVALLNNVRLNNVEKYVYPVRVAVASRPGLAEIEWIGMKERVKATTMQEIMDSVGLDSVDLVKIDIEGAELEVLTSNNDWLERVDSIVMEIHPQVYGFTGVDKIIRSLREKGFYVKVVRNNIDTKLALEKWIRSIGPSPTWLLLTLWKALVATTLRNHKKEYWFAIRFKA
jgi:FkbM family methyltransferase